MIIIIIENIDLVMKIIIVSINIITLRGNFYVVIIIKISNFLL